jgi:hypothetical protein
VNSNNGIFSTFGRFLIQLNAMKVKFLFYGIILWSSFVQAQIDSGNRTLGLPSTVSPPSGFSGKSSIIIPPSEKPLNPKYRTGAHNYLSDQPKDLGFIQNNNFVNPGEKIKNEINAKNKEEEYIDMSIFRRNQDFGEYRLKGDKVHVKCRDHMFVDGDIIRIKLNDKVLKEQIMLASSFFSFDIPLQDGFNKIDFEAVNQGSSGPNTAEFHVYDDRGILISADRWDLATGFKASVIIIKE